jgi:hypothetical protein
MTYYFPLDLYAPGLRDTIHLEGKDPPAISDSVG